MPYFKNELCRKDQIGKDAFNKKIREYWQTERHEAEQVAIISRQNIFKEILPKNIQKI
jgi:hypothetical protein